MDETKNRIIHEYDPVKRREYYLKNRQLKGHVPKAVTPLKVTPPRSAVKPAPNRNQRQEERRRKLQAQVDALKARLQKLREALAELVKAAKARSGVTEIRGAPVAVQMNQDIKAGPGVGSGVGAGVGAGNE
jgi:hypothetical protein